MNWKVHGELMTVTLQYLYSRRAMASPLLSTAVSEFVVEPPTVEVSTGWQGTQSVELQAHAAGPVLYVQPPLRPAVTRLGAEHLH